MHSLHLAFSPLESLPCCVGLKFESSFVPQMQQRAEEIELVEGVYIF